MAKHAVVKKTGLIEQAYATITPLKLADPVARKLRHHLVLEVENVVHQDPKLELKRLVGCHKRWTEQARIMGQMVGDREIRATGEIIKCDKDTAMVADIKATSKALQDRASQLERAMLVQLRQIPAYTRFLERVYGCGPVVAGYLLAFINVERAVKPSMLRRYCGNATDASGRLERRCDAPKNMVDGTFHPEHGGTYNQELRTRLWQMMTAMRKNAAMVTRCERHEAAKPKSSAKIEVKEAFRRECAACPDCLATPKPFGTTSKYLERWAAAKFTQRTCPAPAIDGKVADAERKGRMKATDAFLEDLYMVLRSLEGLEVWPTFATIKRGHAHGGAPVTNAPVRMDANEALGLVGDVGGRKAGSFLFDAGAEEDVVEVE